MDERLMLQRIVSIYTDSGDSLNSACKRTATELNPPRWSCNYIKKLAGANPPNPSDGLRAAIQNLYREKFHKPRIKRFSIKVTANDHDEKEKWLEMIPMERRQELFREELERLENQGSKTGVKQIVDWMLRRNSSS
jgi:hypothetical protein